MSRLFKLALVCFVAGLVLPAEPNSILGNFEPEGWRSGIILLFLRIAFIPAGAIAAYEENRQEPTYDFDHFSEETLIPVLKSSGVMVGLLAVLLAAFWPRMREGRLRYFVALVIFIGGACFARILFPGCAPYGNRYYYYIGAYLLILAFPLASVALARETRNRPLTNGQERERR